MAISNDDDGVKLALAATAVLLGTAITRAGLRGDWGTDTDRFIGSRTAEPRTPRTDIPGLVVKTDGRWHDLKRRDEVPKKVLAEDFDYLDSEDFGAAFLKFQNTWHHLGEFLRTAGGGGHSAMPELATAGWEGIANWSASNGALIQLHPDGERYKIAYYYASAR